MRNIDCIMQSEYVADMKTLTIRDVPDEVYEAICAQAEAGHRSIQQQVRQILEKEARLRGGGFLQAAEKWRAKFAGRKMGGTVQDIRAGRARR